MSRRDFDFFSQLASEGQDRYNMDRIEFIFSQIDQLSPREREIVEGMYVRGLSQREIAAKMKCTPANVSILHGRAVKRLKKLATEQNKRGALAGLAWFMPTK